MNLRKFSKLFYVYNWGVRLNSKLDYDTKLKLDSEYDIYRCDGERPDENEDVEWESSRELRYLSLQENPFFIALY